MFDGKPEDRDSFALYILDIEIDHKEVKGALMPYERISLGKRGDPGFMNHVDSRRLEKENPALFAHLLPVIERWRKTNAITTDGHPVEAWPILSKAQIKSLKNLGLHSVEDVEAATDAIREKYGMGFSDLKKQAKAFLENKTKAQSAKQIADQQKAIDGLVSQLEEAQETIRQLAAKAGLNEKQPAPRKQEAA